MIKFNSKHIVILFIMIVLLVGVSGVVCAQDTNNITGLNNDDMGEIPTFDDGNESLKISNAGDLIAKGTFDDLQVEINKAPEGSVLNLTRDYNGAYGSTIQFNKDLTIDGQGHTLDCLNTECSAFYSSSGKITLINLKIINGHKDDNADGGAIHISGSAQYTIINCTFNNNWVDNNGGAIYNCVNKSLIIINSTFNNNSATYDHHRTDHEGVYDSLGCGGAIYSVGRVYIENSIFESNSAYLNGGAIWCKNGFNVNKCLFEFNKASLEISHGYLFPQGGAIYCCRDITHGNSYINNSMFKKNHAKMGGAIFSSLKGSSNHLNIFNSQFLDNDAEFCGGAIFGDIVNIVNTTFSSNECTDSCGSMLSAFGTAHGGGAIEACRVTIDSSVFDSNHAGLCGGAIYSDYITFNGENIFRSNNADGNGGAIYTDSIVGNVGGVIFTSNFAKNDGGAIFINNEYDGTFRYCMFDKNMAYGKGGAIFANSHFSDITLTHNIFTGNIATMGNSGYTYNIGGLAGDAFILGPNYYGQTADCRENQFYFTKFTSTFIDDFKPFTGPVGDEQRVKTWFNNPLDIYTNNTAEVEDGMTYKEKKTIVDQCFDIAEVLYSGGPTNPMWCLVKGVRAVVDWIDWLVS